MPGAARREKVGAILRQLGLCGRAGNLPGELSVGEQQRVGIARTPVNEPTGDMDAETGRGILELPASCVRDGTRALVVATHGPAPAHFSLKALCLEEGRLVPQDA